MWDLPGPGLEPVSSALAGGFLTTAPPRKPHTGISSSALLIRNSESRPASPFFLLLPQVVGDPRRDLSRVVT